MSEDADDATSDAGAGDGRRAEEDARAEAESRVPERAPEPAAGDADVEGPEANLDDVFTEFEDAPGGADDDVFDRLGDLGVDDPFEDLGVETLPDEDVWADEDGETVDANSIVPEVQESAPDLDVATGEKEAVVDKRRYCESCEYFSDPPEVACSHSGTEIRELVDVDHFKVYACPIVAKRRGHGWSNDE